MRTEQEFLQLVEMKLSGAPVRRPQAKRAVLIAATVALLAATAVAGTILLSRAHPAPGHDTVNDTTPTVGATLGHDGTIPDIGTLQETHGGADDTTRASAAITICPADTISTPETVTTPETGKAPETAVDTGWELPAPSGFVWAGREYHLTAREPFAPTMVTPGKALGDGFFALTGVSTDYFILREEEGLWGYRTYDYCPATLGQLMRDLNLAETLEMGSLWYDEFTDDNHRSWRIEGLAQETLWAMLFANPDAAPERLTVKMDPEEIVRQAAEQGIMVAPPYDPTGQYIYDRAVAADVSIAISLPQLGIRNLSIMLSREGWLWTNLLTSGNYFAVSPSLVDDVLSYAEAAGNWIDTTPDYGGALTSHDILPVPEDTIGEPDVVTFVTSARAEETVTHYATTRRP